MYCKTLRITEKEKNYKKKENLRINFLRKYFSVITEDQLLSFTEKNVCGTAFLKFSPFPVVDLKWCQKLIENYLSCDSSREKKLFQAVSSTHEHSVNAKPGKEKLEPRLEQGLPRGF